MQFSQKDIYFSRIGVFTSVFEASTTINMVKFVNKDHRIFEIDDGV
jgi:hypothetical protein